MNNRDFSRPETPEPIELQHKTIEEDLYVDRYLMDKLSPEERAGFENHFLTCARCLEELKLAESFRQAMRDNEAIAIHFVKKRRLLEFLLAWMRQQRAMIGSAVLILCLLPLFLSNGNSGPTPELLNPPFSRQAHVLDLNTMRGNSNYAQANDFLELRFHPETPDWVLRGSLSKQIEKVRLQLLDHDGKTLWEGETLNNHLFFAVRLPSGFLKEGHHQLIVNQVTGDGEVYPLAYKFNVVILPKKSPRKSPEKS